MDLLQNDDSESVSCPILEALPLTSWDLIKQ